MNSKIFLHEDISRECHDCGALIASIDAQGVRVDCDVERALTDVSKNDPAGNAGILATNIARLRGQMVNAGCPFNKIIGPRMQYPCRPLEDAASEIKESEQRIKDKRRERQRENVEKGRLGDFT